MKKDEIEGRLIDFIENEKHWFGVKNVRWLILDEADAMIGEGLDENIRKPVRSKVPLTWIERITGGDGALVSQLEHLKGEKDRTRMKKDEG